jgi:L-alanine-DL-glutamate epimerase-like enolase superfamily enzyme
MKITDLRVHCCRMPLTPLERGGIAPYQLSYRIATHVDRYFTEVITDSGLTGWGEGELTLSADAMRTFYAHDLKSALLGVDPREINRVRGLFRQTTFKKYLNEQVFLAPVETACWDILGRSVDLPLFALLGGKLRDRVRCAFLVGVLPHNQLAKIVSHGASRGFRTIKLKGDTDFRRDVDRLTMLGEKFPELEFRLDPNQAWTFGDCIRFVEAVRHLKIEYLEQPVRVQSLAEVAQLRARSHIPIALNDDCYGPWTLDAIVRAQAADVGIVDLEPLGGVAGLVRAAHFAETANLALTHHTGFDHGIKTAAVLHVAAAMPATFRLALDCTYMSQDDDVLTTRLRFDGEELTVPDGPGLGIEVDRAKLEKYAI